MDSFSSPKRRFAVLATVCTLFVLISCNNEPFDNGEAENGYVDTSPKVVSVLPEPDATSVSVLPTISVTFSEQLVEQTEGTAVRFFTDSDDVDFSHSYNGTIIQIEPVDELEEFTIHHIEIDHFYIVDLSDEMMSESYLWSFTTGADTLGPSIVSIAPEDGAIDVARSSAVSITFSEAMGIYATAAAFTLSNASTTVPGNFIWDENTIRFTPNTSFECITYYATISTDATDDSGNALSESLTWSFTCGMATAIAAGSNHSLAVMSGGTVKGWGYNIYGQIGDDENLNRNTPYTISGPTDIVAVSGGKYHSVALRSDGTITAWGSNYSGQLGDGTIEWRDTPVNVTGVDNATAIATGLGYHTLALLSDGTVKAWGKNNYGQLGNGTTTDSPSAVTVAGISNATAIAAGGEHSVALLADGTVVCWGRNNAGQLGNGTTADSSTPVTVLNITSAVVIAAGENHSLAVLEDGTVRAWGVDSRGQLGDGFNNDYKSTPVTVDESQVEGAITVAAGEGHSVALLDSGTIMGWGDNTWGQIGGGLGATSYPIPITTGSFTDTTAIAAGADHTHALFPDGIVRSWGSNTYGQLGDGGYLPSDSPVEVIDL